MDTTSTAAPRFAARAARCAATTPPTTPRSEQAGARSGPRASLGVVYDSSGRVLAAKAPPKFSQGTASEAFAHGPFAGRTIGDVASGLRSGSVSPSDLPVEVIQRGGETLALNTRSALALRRGGVNPSDWAIRDVTGNAARERLLTRRLARNDMSGGSDVIRITGAGRHASSTR